MRARQSKIKSDPNPNWPEGWEVEAQRLADLYVRFDGYIKEFDDNLAERRSTAQELKKLKALGGRFSRGLEGLFVHDADPLVWMYRTCSSGRELTDVSQGELDRYIAYRGRIKDLAALTDEIVADLDGAIGHLADTSSLERGNQSTLALRCTIDAAASAYVRLFGKAPGRSRADYRTFGRFVSAIIDRIPKHKCPPMPSASAISDVVEQWHQRRPVA